MPFCHLCNNIFILGTTSVTYLKGLFQHFVKCNHFLLRAAKEYLYHS